MCLVKTKLFCESLNLNCEKNHKIVETDLLFGYYSGLYED